MEKNWQLSYLANIIYNTNTGILQNWLTAERKALVLPCVNINLMVDDFSPGFKFINKDCLNILIIVTFFKGI